MYGITVTDSGKYEARFIVPEDDGSLYFVGVKVGYGSTADEAIRDLEGKAQGTCRPLFGMTNAELAA